MSSHSEKITAVKASETEVKFSPQVRKRFSALEKAVRNSEHFDDDLRVNLQELAAGKQLSVPLVLSGVANITRETMEHVHATGDSNAKTALDNLILDLMGREVGAKPVELATQQSKSRLS